MDNLEGDTRAKFRRLLDPVASDHSEAIPFALTMLTKRLEAPWQLIRLATELVRSKNAADIAAVRYAVSAPIILDHLDDRRIELNHALRSNRIPIAKDILTDIYDIEHALRIRIDRIDETDWGRKLSSVMAAVASDLQTELKTLPISTTFSHRTRFTVTMPNLLC